MKIFLIKVIVFSLSIYTLLFIVHNGLVTRLNSDSNYLPEGGFDYTFQDKDFSIIWLGNSRTFVHVDQRVINEIYNQSSYSLVQDGGDPSILFYKISNYLNNNSKPHTINIQCDYTMAKRNFRPEKIQVSQLFNWKMKKYLETTYDWVDQIYFYVPLISFDLTTIVKTIVKYRPERFYNGYYSCDESFGYKTDLLWNYNFIRETYDLTRSNYLDSIIKVCIDKGIYRVNLWTPPSSIALEKSIIYSPNLDSTAKFYSSKYEMEINHIDLRDTLKYNDSSFFYNHTHLNTNGVNELTNSIKLNSKALLEVSH